MAAPDRCPDCLDDDNLTLTYVSHVVSVPIDCPVNQ
jgi:hypothetical protein